MIPDDIHESFCPNPNFNESSLQPTPLRRAVMRRRPDKYVEAVLRNRRGNYETTRDIAKLLCIPMRTVWASLKRLEGDGRAVLDGGAWKAV